MKIGQTITDLRKKREFTQAELAKAVGITTTALSLIENDQSKPHKSTMETICKVLRVPESMLYVLAITEEDVPKEKQLVFKYLGPTLKNIINQLIDEE